MKLRQASEMMRQPALTIRAERPLLDAIREMLQHAVSGLPVVDEKDELVGMITEHDIMNFAFSGDAADATVREAMSTDLTTFGPGDDIKTIADAFLKRRIRRVPIVRDRRVIGIVSRHDVLRVIASWYDEY